MISILIVLLVGLTSLVAFPFGARKLNLPASQLRAAARARPAVGEHSGEFRGLKSAGWPDEPR